MDSALPKHLTLQTKTLKPKEKKKVEKRKKLEKLQEGCFSKRPEHKL